MPVGATYAPVPLGGFVTLVFMCWSTWCLAASTGAPWSPSTTKRPNPEAPDGRLVLLGSFIALMLMGMPVAYALGLSALIGAWWIDIPYDA
jgi:hypothetical protein